MEDSLLNKINGPEDLRNLEKKSLPRLAQEIRERIIDVVSRNGGHLASNLGAVELSMALHLAFESPKDKLIWDVGHQCYTHKLLTGRNKSFDSIRKKDGISGFPKNSESPHDIVETGHASTSISEALGVLTGQDVSGEEGAVVAIIGDGAMTGGMAFEALNHAGHLKKQLIVILNDNTMSISKNVGALTVSGKWLLSNYLSRLFASKRYQKLREKFDQGIKGLPVIGMKLFDLSVRIRKGFKAVLYKESIFSDLGFEYVGPIDGHSISKLKEVFEEVKKIGRPTVVHVVTQKGRGYEHAEGNPTLFHGIAPFTIEDGKLTERASYSFTAAFSDSIVKYAESDSRITAITAAMSKGTGLHNFQERFPDRFFDAGIAEEHAVAFAAGQARAGCRPVVAIYSTFMQRTVDQVFHDIALPGLPVIIAMDRAGLVGDDGETHQGLYDIALFKSVPGMTIIAPGCRQEMAAAMDYALSLNGPCMLRYPKASALSCDDMAVPWQTGRGRLLSEGPSNTLLITPGGILKEARTAAAELREEGLYCDIYNLRFIKPLDEEYLAEILDSYTNVICIEDSARIGGIGETIASIVLKRQLNCRFSYYGLPDAFYAQGTREELLTEFELDPAGIAARVRLVEETELSLYTRERKVEGA
ncbi:1-deoxy-D-xylulose-5-phosphate synthase [Marispirochaeta sp.]|jgi:1-deoxy-D-xylulose-5-phosphate synthase|uniref:1-deoxy-D-xylulose-5-phosphate synthase n=1 Tax=Marispirochaeta sp. TaxID=2038653 RepID=UPI0029C64ED7|nr:1-deoxy-D-xylulose-5-phosphate synthase [Marispirochaeta sp.]